MTDKFEKEIDRLADLCKKSDYIAYIEGSGFSGSAGGKIVVPEIFLASLALRSKDDHKAFMEIWLDEIKQIIFRDDFENGWDDFDNCICPESVAIVDTVGDWGTRFQFMEHIED
jgi:hypothetical protein